MATCRIYQPSSVTFSNGSKTIDGAESFSVNETMSASPAAGDADLYATALIPGVANVSVGVTASDVAPGMTLGTVATTLTASFKVAQRTTGASISIATVMYLGCSAAPSHAGAAMASHNFQAYSATGSTSPVSWSNAS